MTHTPSAHPYAAFLADVEKPSRYVGGERGAITKEWDEALGRLCLAFPDVYDLGMSHLGFKILYSIVNAHPKLLAERCYAPWSDMEAALRAHGEVLRSLENARPLREFDVVGFSLQFELTYTNVLSMLDLGGIPLRSDQRVDSDPLILVGGPVATHAEPLAPFFDAAVIGDGEEKTSEVVLTWCALRRAGVPRRERLRELAKLGGVYVPSLYDTEVEPQTGHWVVRRPDDEAIPYPVQRTFVENLDAYPFPTDGPISATETIFDRVSVEIARGCTEGCRFCQAGMIYRPVRERSPESILASITDAVKEGGYDEASLTSLSTADYSAIHPLVKAVMKRFESEKVALSVSSLRAYGLDEGLLDEIRKVRATGLTFAPEAGTQRMRDVINKNITEEQLMLTAERVFSRGWSKMKLYFMLGLPTETDEDVLGIVETAAKAQNVGRRVQKGRPEVTASCSIHVPKPHTPFQWCAMDSKAEVSRKKELLRRAAHEANVRLKLHPTDGSWLEGVLARGDRRLADVIEHAYRGGARFDSWEEHMDWGRWARAFEATAVDPTPFLGTLPIRARLPWDHLHVGLEDGFLAREYQKALKSRLSPPCGKVAGASVQATNLQDALAEKRKLVCYDCGIACDMTAMREERLVFLRTLGAHERPSPPAKIEGKVRPMHERPPERLPQGAPRRLRLTFTKLGTAAYRGHLDLVRLMPRIFRRAGLPLWYSEGFHPKPDMVFGPPLPLGVSSLEEVLDLKLDSARPYELTGLVERLNAVTEPGLEFTAAIALGPDDAGVSKILDEATFVAGLPRNLYGTTLLAHLRSDAEVAHHLGMRITNAAHSPLIVEREVKGLSKKIDLERYLGEVRVGVGQAALDASGLHGDLLPIEVVLRLHGDGAVRVGEVLEALLRREGDRLEFPLQIVRTALRASGLRVIDVEALRAMRRSRPVALPEPTPMEVG